MGKDAPNENRDNKNRTQSHSFGVGRENMRKIHVEKIILNKDGYTPTPDAGQYEHKTGFGGSTHNETTAYSMR